MYDRAVVDQTFRTSEVPVGKELKKGNETVAMPDARVRQIKDQLIRSKVYLSLQATKSNPQFIRELRLRIKEVQRVLGTANKDLELPRRYINFRAIVHYQFDIAFSRPKL